MSPESPRLEMLNRKFVKNQKLHYNSVDYTQPTVGGDTTRLGTDGTFDTARSISRENIQVIHN